MQFSIREKLLCSIREKIKFPIREKNIIIIVYRINSFAQGKKLVWLGRHLVPTIRPVNCGVNHPATRPLSGTRLEPLTHAWIGRGRGLCWLISRKTRAVVSRKQIYHGAFARCCGVRSEEGRSRGANLTLAGLQISSSCLGSSMSKPQSFQ